MIFETPLTRNRCSSSLKPTQNTTKNHSKKHFKSRPSEIDPISRLGGSKTELRAQKAFKRLSQGRLTRTQNLKNDVPEGLQIQLACKGSPRRLRWPLGGPFLIDFWLILRPFLRPCGIAFGLILKSILKVLAYCDPACTPGPPASPACHQSSGH